MLFDAVSFSQSEKGQAYVSLFIAGFNLLKKIRFLFAFKHDDTQVTTFPRFRLRDDVTYLANVLHN